MNNQKNLSKTKKLSRKFLSFGIGAVVLMGVLGVMGGTEKARAETIIFSGIETTARKDTSTTVQYDTDIAATGQIEYGLDTSYGSLTEEKRLSYWQTIELTGLTEGITYHYRIRAKDYEDNETVSGDHTFTTRTEEELEVLVRVARINNDLSKEYYVKTDGDDNNNGLTIETAWQHPSYATQMAESGDVIYLLDGIWYDEHCVFAHSGIDTHPITLTAYNGTPTFDGIDKTGCGLDIDENDHIKISHLTMRRYYRTIDEPGSYIHVSNCDLSDTGEAVMVISRPYSTNNTIENCTLYDSGWNTIQLLANRAPPNGNGIPTTNITVRNCTIYNSNVHNAIDLYGNMEHILIEDNLIHDCSCAGVFVHDRPDLIGHTVVRNNIFKDMGFISPIDLGEAYSWEIYNNTFINSTANYPIYIYLNSRDIWIHDNEFYNTESPRVVEVFDNIVFDRNYLHTDCNPYMSSYNATITVRNPLGGKSIDVRFNGSIAHLEWDDGTVFVATPFDDYISWTPVRYYPDRSVCSITSGDDAALIGSVTTYNITLQPTTENEYLTVSSVSESPDTAIVESTISINPTTIGYTNLSYANTNVILMVDDENYSSALANAEGKVSHYYEGTWDTAHTFTWKQGEISTGILTGTITNSSDIAIEGATVSDGIHSTTTDSDGNYTFSSIPLGTYTITCTKENYQDNSQPNIIIEEDQTTTLNFTLLEVQTPTITLQKQVDKTEAQKGEALTYTITYINTGNAQATNIVITDDIPINTTYIDNSATESYTYDSDNKILTWTIDSLDAGEEGVVSFQVRVDEGEIGMRFDEKYLALVSIAMVGVLRKRRINSKPKD